VSAKKATYASGDAAKKVKEDDRSTTLVFEAGNFKYHDNYFGGEPYGGREVVSYEDKPIYMMVYYGSVGKEVDDVRAVYQVLQKALSLLPEYYPYRGPKEFTEGSYRYENEYIGEIDNFSGRETISCAGKIVYQARYAGGLVDQR
jgi:hypothetical protein